MPRGSGRTVGLGARAPSVARPPRQRAAPPACRPLCPSLDPERTDPYRAPHPPTESRTTLDLDTEHSLQAACPAHRYRPWRRWLGRISARHRRHHCTQAPMRRRHRRPILTVRCQHPVITRQVHPRCRHQRRETLHQIQRFEHDVRGAIPVRRLERVAHLTGCRQRQALAGHRRTAHIPAQPFEIRALIRRNVHACVQGEPARSGRTLRLTLQNLQPPWRRRSDTRRPGTACENAHSDSAPSRSAARG